MTHVFAPGDSFRGYKIERLLGEGGLGSVWLARHAMLDTLFAVKVLDRDIAAIKPEYVKRFVREAKLATKIRHPNLVAVHDAGYDEKLDVYYLVMDYVAGSTLRLAVAMGGPKPEAEAAAVVLQIADVLETAKRLGLVHRDLKPENIMLAPDGSVRLLDLGVAKVSSHLDSLRTMASSVFGTPDYIAPEQAMDSSAVDTRADIYSLGVILFELLSGRRPFEGRTPAEVLSKLLGDTPAPDVREFAPSVSPAMAAIVAKMCAKRPEERYASSAELIAALQSAGFSAGKAPAGSIAAGDDRTEQSVGDILASCAAAPHERTDTMTDITLETQDPDIRNFLAKRRRRRIVSTAIKAAVAAAAAAAVALIALKACGETVPVAECERSPEQDEWAAGDAAFAKEVMRDVFEKAGVQPEYLPFGPDAMFDQQHADVITCAFRTPDLDGAYDFPVQPLSKMHFALYATPERAKQMMNIRITEWPRMRVGYSPVAQGQDGEREHYFERATLSPEYVEFPTSRQAESALRDGSIDLLFLYTPEGRRPDNLVEIVPIGSRYVYFAVKKGKADLLKRLESAYRECYIDNVDRYDVLRERLLGVPKPASRVRVAAYLRGHLFGVSQRGDRSGVIAEWLNAVAGQAHWTIDYVYGNYAESVRDVMSGRLDMVGGLGFSAERGESLLYSHTPIGMLRVYMWTKRDSRFEPGDQSTWKGMKVGILAGSFSADRVKQQLKASGNPRGIVCREYISDAELMEAYFNGEIDACVDIETPALNNERALHVYVSHPMYICVSPARRELFYRLEIALDHVCDDFPKYMRMIEERHYGIRDEMSLLTFAEADWLRKRSVDPSPVMVDFSPWPVNLRNESGETVYFAKYFLEALSRRTGLKFDAQPQTGIQTAEAKFLRGDTKLWIPYPAPSDVAAANGVSVLSIPVPKSYAQMIGNAGQNGTLELWARHDVPEELVGIIGKAVSGMAPEDIQEMFIKAVAERTTAKHVFGFTEEEFERFLLVAGFAAVSLVAAFAIVMVLLLKRQVRCANRATAVAEEYSRAKTRFLAMMSHELRTPLNAVIGYAEFLPRADCTEERRREYISGIRLSANALLDLINDILDLSKLDTGAMHMLKGECDVERAVEELPAIFNGQIRSTGVQLVIRRTSPDPVPVLGLSQQGFKQILINLVGNSVKFTESGEIRVEYGWDNATHTLSLAVHDTGCGISDEKMACLFDPFVQDISSRMKHAAGEIRGTGLGLPIVKRMVDNAEGTVEVKSRPGQGTDFSITIPSLSVVRPAPPRRAELARNIPSKVLIVDDIKMNRSILGVHMRNLQVKDIRFAENGADALEAMKDWTPDCVLTDIWMPVMDGQQLAMAMKADARLASIPIIAITADVDVAATYDMSPFANILAKPVTGAKLEALFA